MQIFEFLALLKTKYAEQVDEIFFKLQSHNFRKLQIQTNN